MAGCVADLALAEDPDRTSANAVLHGIDTQGAAPVAFIQCISNMVKLATANFAFKSCQALSCDNLTDAALLR